MSKVSQAYAMILSALGELYPTHTRIPNPYSLPDNNSKFLIKGYGLKVGSSDFQPLEFCDWMTGRGFSVVLTREVVRLDSDATKFDDKVPQLLEDVFEIQEKLFNKNFVGNQEYVLDVQLGSVTEVTGFISGKNNFYQMEANFTFSIKESFK